MDSHLFGPTCAQPPPLSTSPTSGAFVTINEPAQTRHNPPGSLADIGVHPVGLDKCTETRAHHHSTTQSVSLPSCPLGSISSPPPNPCPTTMDPSTSPKRCPSRAGSQCAASCRLPSLSRVHSGLLVSSRGTTAPLFSALSDVPTSGGFNRSSPQLLHPLTSPRDALWTFPRHTGSPAQALSPRSPQSSGCLAVVKAAITTSEGSPGHLTPSLRSRCGTRESTLSDSIHPAKNKPTDIHHHLFNSKMHLNPKAGKSTSK